MSVVAIATYLAIIKYGTDYNSTIIGINHHSFYSIVKNNNNNKVSTRAVKIRKTSKDQSLH